MTITSFDPFSTLDRMFGRGSMSGSGRSMTAMPAMDVYRKGDEYVIELEIPGVDPSTVDVDVERNMLSVSGETRPGHEQADELLVCERPHARFRRQVYLGENLDTERIEANASDGVLSIRVPVAEQQRARKVSVQGGRSEGRDVIDVGNGSEGAEGGSSTSGEGAR